MQIAQIAPLTEAIPPKLYGGTERVISWLADELVALGHDVVLFASGDSQTSANLEACWPKALRLDGSVRDPNALHMAMLEQVRQRAHDFDLLHFHLDYYPFSLVSRQPTADAGWIGTIHHGLPERLLTPQPVRPAYFAFLGRISPEKAVEQAIWIAKRSGVASSYLAECCHGSFARRRVAVRWCVVLMVAKGQRPHPRRTATITLRRFIRSPRRRAREACQEFGGQAPWRS